MKRITEKMRNPELYYIDIDKIRKNFDGLFSLSLSNFYLYFKESQYYIAWMTPKVNTHLANFTRIDGDLTLVKKENTWKQLQDCQFLCKVLSELYIVFYYWEIWTRLSFIKIVEAKKYLTYHDPTFRNYIKQYLKISIEK